LAYYLGVKVWLGTTISVNKVETWYSHLWNHLV
jgi:hypothetical protein